MAQLAFKGSNTEGDKIIRILNTLGGKNKLHCTGKFENRIYFINKNGIIESIEYDMYSQDEHLVMGIKGFLKMFPYEFGDTVIVNGVECLISDIRWLSDEEIIKYEIFYKYNSPLNGWYYSYELIPLPKKESDKEERHVNQITEDIFIDQLTSKCSLIVLQPDVCDNEVEIQLGDYEIEERDGKTFAVLKKKKYNMDSFCEAINIIKKYSNIDEQYIINMVDCHLYLNISDNIVNQITDEDVETISNLGFEIFEGTICMDNYFYKYN